MTHEGSGRIAAHNALPESIASPFPVLNQRTLGWLRFLWEKAVTIDDWTSNGVPHPWWDRYTAPVVLSYGRFDLSFSAYGVLMMADQTPAWREVYTRITDEFASGIRPTGERSRPGMIRQAVCSTSGRTQRQPTSEGRTRRSGLRICPMRMPSASPSTASRSHGLRSPVQRASASTRRSTPATTAS